VSAGVVGHTLWTMAAPAQIRALCREELSGIYPYGIAAIFASIDRSRRMLPRLRRISTRLPKHGRGTGKWWGEVLWASPPARCCLRSHPTVVGYSRTCDDGLGVGLLKPVDCRDREFKRPGTREESGLVTMEGEGNWLCHGCGPAAAFLTQYGPMGRTAFS